MSEIRLLKDMISPLDGLFQHMSFDFTSYTDMTKSQMDVMFFTNYLTRPVAPIVDYVHPDLDGQKLTTEQLNALASLVENCYSKKWSKLGEISIIEYDPIHNFLDQYEEDTEFDDDGTVTSTKTGSGSNTLTHDVTETSTLSGSDTVSKTGTDTIDVDSTNTRTDDLTDTLTNNLTETTSKTENRSITKDIDTSSTDSGANNKYGFNSGTAVGYSTDSSSGSGTHDESNSDNLTVSGTVTNTGTETDVKTGTQTNVIDSTTMDTQNLQEETEYGRIDTKEKDGTETNITSSTLSQSDVKANSGTGHKEGSRMGNIGNITTQSFIKQEIGLWQWNFINQVMEDVKEFVLLPIYI